ncbi:hypothetical protein LCI18_003405 [Fusarium solani-melongenae]|uniref:Uncharacterized protein n=1 Tax=Fusarium solani subsp. cucurbitae TaxID=2747967 RepID=A0ACD3YUA0_FUSSC|nr:hypothetical protein LCI18_003405 [Fusarium solani-melongenae]
MPFSDLVWQSRYDAGFVADANNLPQYRELRSKRRKTQLACNCCRVRKTKCDGGRPVCYACEKRGSREDCLYEEGTLRTRRHIQALETRLEQLERGYGPKHTSGSQRSSRRQWQRDFPSRPSPPLGGGTVNTSGVPDKLIPSASHVTHSQSTLGGDSATTALSNQAGSPDALATVSTCVRHHDQLYGASSTIAFVEHVFVTTDETDGPSKPNTDGFEPATHNIGQSGLQIKNLTGLEFLPIRRISDSYLESFWDIVHPVFPVLHKPTFMQFYCLLWEPARIARADTTVDDPVLLATLNLVLAIGCRFTQRVDLDSRAIQADQFYQRARGLVPIDSLDVASLPTVQLLLLTAIHLQSTTYSSRCWNMVGLATRVAQSLGLHLNRGESETSNQLEREMRRRVWYTCVTLDRLMCTTFGRPAMLPHNSQVPLPLMVDDEYLLKDGEGTQAAAIQCRMGLFVYTVQLFDILGEILDCFYAEAGQAKNLTTGKHQERSMSDLHEMLRLNSKLDQFLEALPSNLRLQTLLESSETPIGTALLQARILYCRFLYTRLLLLRPVILFLSRSASSRKLDRTPRDQNSLGDEIAGRMRQVCLDTAHELISVLYQDMDSVYRCSAWWTVYFTFGAATVLLASLLSSLEDTMASVDASLSLAMEIFKHYINKIESSAQAIQVIEVMKHRLSHFRNIGASTSHRESQHDELPLGLSPQDSAVVSGSNFSNFEGHLQGLEPDPFTEDWFSYQAMAFDFQDYL